MRSTRPCRSFGRSASLVGLSFVASVVLLSGCNGSNDNADPTSSVPETSVAVSDPSPANQDSGQDSGASADGTDATGLITDAIAKLGPNYHFATSVKVGDQVVLSAQGDRVGEGSRISLSGDAGVVSYVIVGGASWAKPDDGVWAQLESAPANADPLAALARATSATVVKAEGETTTVEVTVANSDLGIAGDGSSQVTVQITSGVLVFVVYATTVDNQAAVVATEPDTNISV